ncbi:hypothetical protein [Shewanella sp. MBTL60-007]|uniref:DUF7661 family protein n=1 Tax=Shewanella sp. MBTL60-007 TaxID=2815911 RepID=UPI001BC546FB|nr:hypothetical protein [Shewanella sp. MBTL60-007]GIU18581.1 hypothetical protein TUM3792_14880 [Shewanella sp. MBTL60-007]
MSFKFDVFGKLMFVERINNEWLLFHVSVSGMRSRVYDVVIPSELKHDELAVYLDDIFHEQSSNNYPSVRALSE